MQDDYAGMMRKYARRAKIWTAGFFLGLAVMTGSAGYGLYKMLTLPPEPEARSEQVGDAVGCMLMGLAGLGVAGMSARSVIDNNEEYVALKKQRLEEIVGRRDD